MNKCQVAVVFVALICFSMPEPSVAPGPWILLAPFVATTIASYLIREGITRPLALRLRKRLRKNRRLTEKGNIEHKLNWRQDEEMEEADRIIHKVVHDHLTHLEHLMDPGQREKLLMYTVEEQEDAIADAFERWAETHLTELEAAEKESAKNFINEVEFHDSGEVANKATEVVGHKTLGSLTMLTAGMLSVLGVTLVFITSRSTLRELVWQRTSDMVDEEELCE